MAGRYAGNPVWADVQPVPQDDGPDPVCPIAYTADFVETMDYFRAVLQRDERSVRSLALTQHVIEINPANYTAWYFRRLVLAALGPAADWEAELRFCEEVALAQQKNYQIWHHRQTCVTRLGAAVRERDLAHCARMLEDDSKNYHVWSYRQWAVLHHGALTDEDAFTRLMIERDVRNNSAWNERFWTAEQLGWLRDSQLCAREVDYALQQARRAPSNESPWLYIRGIAQHCPAAVDVARLEQLASQWVLCVPVRALLVVLHEKRGNTEAALQLCRDCASSVDTMRSKYWNYRAATIQNKLVK